MRRILIVGMPGAGKSTLAVELGRRLDLPVYHLDKYYWQPGWVETEREIWRQAVTELVAGDKWIMDGNYFSTQDIRFPRADTIINLDFSTPFCLWRVLKRMIHYWGRTRPDLTPGCNERVDLSFFHWVLRFKRDQRPITLQSIKKYFKGDKIITLYTTMEINSFLKDVV